MYQQKKTDYQRGYEDGEELIVAHVNLDGRSKAKEYIKKLADKNKGKTDALNDFINNSASYFVPPQILQEYNTKKKNNMKRSKIILTESQLKKIISENVSQILKYNDELLKNAHDRKMVGESLGVENQEDVMDAIIMLKEAYFDLQEFTKLNRTAGLDLSEAMGNLRGAIKILNNIEKNKRQNTDIL